MGSELSSDIGTLFGFVAHLKKKKVLSVRYFKCEMINMAQISSFLLDITSLVSPSQSHPVADGFDAIGASQDDDL